MSGCACSSKALGINIWVLVLIIRALDASLTSNIGNVEFMRSRTSTSCAFCACAASCQTIIGTGWASSVCIYLLSFWTLCIVTRDPICFVEQLIVWAQVTKTRGGDILSFLACWQFALILIIWVLKLIGWTLRASITINKLTVWATFNYALGQVVWISIIAHWAFRAAFCSILTNAWGNSSTTARAAVFILIEKSTSPTSSAH